MRITIVRLLTYLALTFPIIPSCKTKQLQQENTPMQVHDYSKSWSEIDSLERNQLYQSALERTQALQQVALHEDVGAQIVKAAIYINKYAVYLNEDGLVQALSGMEQALADSKDPVKSILYSLTAELYSAYLQSQAWKLKDRTNLDAVPGPDVQTWDISDFIEKINTYYFASLQYDALRTIPVTEYEAILTKGTNTDHLRPVLYDILGHRAIDYFMQHYAYLTDPVYAYAITDLELLAPAQEFVKYTITSPDAGSYKRKTLEIFQDLIDFHLNSKATNMDSPDALIDVDLDRLQFVYENLENEGKDDAYLHALEALEKKYPKAAAIAEIGFAKASYFQQRASKYKGGPDDPYKYDLRKALEQCQQVISKYPGTKGAIECQNLVNVLTQPELNVQTEQVNIKTDHLLVSIAFTNMKNVWLKVVPMDQDDRSKLEGRPEAIISYLNGLTALQQKNIVLPSSDDLRQHTTEVALDPLSYGFYALVISDDNFKSGSLIAYNLFHVSDLAFWNYSDRDVNQYVIVDRKSGNPLQGVKADFYTREYNSSSRRNVLRSLGSVTTNADGIATAPARDQRQNILVKLTKASDVLFLDDSFYQYSYRSTPEARNVVYLFTDRSIYRPGQPVYFKGYLVNYDRERMPSVLPNGKVTITFNDANGQKIESREFSPNAYGTFSGEFTAPFGKLLGAMSLTASGTGQGSTRVQVEEYKRPTFEVTFDPADKAFKLGESVKVLGKATTYAGVPSDNSTVAYRVVRRTHFPWYPWWMRMWMPDSPEMIITQGTTTTDENGAFEIMFEGRGDKSIANQKPEYEFSITADVTDAAGETRTGTKKVILAAYSFKADVGLTDQTEIPELNHVTVQAKNLNGEDVTLKGRVSIAQLQAPDQPLRERFWSAPDQPLLSDTEYRSLFPSYAIPGKERMSDWTVLNETGARDFTIRGSDSIALGGIIKTPGAYRFTFRFTGDNGDTSSLVLYSTCFQPHAKLPKHLLLSQSLEAGPKEPGTTVEHSIQSSTALSIRYITDRQINIQREWLTPDGAVQPKITVVEKDRGGLRISGTYVYDNRVYDFQQNVNVPWSNKDLSIEYLSIRDKTEPGADEEWRLKITGSKRDAVVAEMLATMYDASLDAFLPHSWSLSLYPSYGGSGYIRTVGFSASYLRYVQGRNHGEYRDVPETQYRDIDWFNFPKYDYRVLRRGDVAFDGVRAQAPPMAMEEAAPSGALDLREKNANSDTSESDQSQQEQEQPEAPVALRTNLKETVFFMPHIVSEPDGSIVLKFKMNESLTRWKFLALAHTKDLRFGLAEKEIVTQKDIMVFPHMPRFLRQKDQIRLTAKVHNMTETASAATAELNIIDGFSGANVNGLFGLTNASKTIQLPASGSSGVQWDITVPEDWTTPVKYQVIARMGSKGDGEEGILPVLTDRIFVTETMALHISSKADKTFVFDAFRNTTSNTLETQGYTVEITSNPAWLAVQSLPYLQEYPHQCAEQIFSRLYANLVARKIITEFPTIGKTYQRWSEDPNSVSLMSNLSKNQELKSAMLEETPWVRDAMSEEEQMRNIAKLLDGGNISAESVRAISALKQMQLSNGGFPWFPGGRDNWYITQYIVESAGHLSKMQAIDPAIRTDLMQMINSAVTYIDARMLEEYQELAQRVQEGKAKWEDDHLSHMATHYLYARSFFMQQQSNNDVAKARDYYLNQSEKYWNNRPLYVQGLIALALKRWNRPTVVKTMKQSFEERSLYSEELGRHWKTEAGYYWYQLPIETQALMIELFEELGADQSWIDELRLWLLKNKQTNRWESTKATAAAVYALLMQEDNWLEGAQVAVIVGGKPLSSATAEAGSGYVKESWHDDQVSKAQSEIKVSNPNNHVAWGGVYWQYFEDMDKVESATGTPLKMRKGLYKQVSTDEGLKLVDLSSVNVGDKLISRIEIEVDRDMEFVHLKDMRASGLEPINVLSGYKWQGGLGYYESTADLATHFFFDFLPRGKYVFEYPVRVAHAGKFSNGIATLQSMYAPEFSSHSGGLRFEVQN